MPSLFLLVGATGAVVLGVTWVFYPLVMGALSAMKTPRQEESAPQPSVSVILATREPHEIIQSRVENLLQTQYPMARLEIIVAIDPTSGKNLPDLSSPRDEVKVRTVLGEEPGGKAMTLNGGAAAATGEILLFCDSHQRFTSTSIPELVAALSDPRIGAVSGNLTLPSRDTGSTATELYWRFERWLRARESRVHSSIGVTGAIWATRRELWEPLPPGLILDDLYTPMRLAMEGYRVSHVTTALARETRLPSAEQEGHRKTRTLTGNLQFFFWVPQVFLPWKNPVFLPFLFHKVFRLLTPFAFILMVVGGMGFLLATRSQLFPWVLGFLAALGLWLLAGFPRPAIQVRGILKELLLTQASILKALVNGMRGRWDVWSPQHQSTPARTEGDPDPGSEPGSGVR
jgi:cellulose synthase/poly-beta-1,6-N-acetylglucosamine synthase-like glycosyltransferase